MLENKLPISFAVLLISISLHGISLRRLLLLKIWRRISLSDRSQVHLRYEISKTRHRQAQEGLGNPFRPWDPAK